MDTPASDNSDIVPSDDVVAQIVSAELRGRGKSAQLYYRVELKTGGFILRPFGECACPEAIAAFERRYFRAKVVACFDEESEAAADDQSGTDMDTKADDDGTFSLPGACFDEDDEQEGHSQKTKASSATASEPSEYDDGYLDNVASDDSLWAFQVDEDGRSALDPAVRAKMRAALKAGDTTFKSPPDHGSSSSSSLDSTPSHKAKGKAATTPSSATTEDSLMKELGAKENMSPQATPSRKAVAERSVRRHARRVLFGDNRKGKVDLSKVKLEPLDEGNGPMQPSTSKVDDSPGRLSNVWQAKIRKYALVTVPDDDDEAPEPKKAKITAAEEDVDCITLDDD